MENRFAKLFEVKGEQVLVTKEYDDSDEETPFKLTIRMELEGVKAEMSPCFKNEEGLNKAFDGFTQENAEKYYKAANEMLTEK